MNAAVSTSGAGTLFLRAGNGTVDAAGVTVDGINLDNTLSSGSGDILLSSARDIRQTQQISSTSGDVGLLATRDMVHTDSGDISTTSGDVLVEAGRNWSMTTGTVITAGGGDVDGKAVTGDLALGRINAARVALTAGGDVSDANGTTLNVDGTSLSLRAGGLIGNHNNTNGTPDLNANAIDTRVTTLAASSASGIYVEESDSLTIGTVAAVTVNVSGPLQVNFNSTTTNVGQSRTTSSLEDLTTSSHGPIKVVTLAGTLTINAGTAASGGVAAHGTGDILLQARGAASDVIVNADISSDTGHLTLDAADSIVVNHDIETRGSGSVYAVARAGVFTLNDADSNSVGIITQFGDVLIDAATTVTLNANLQSSGDIAVQAGQDVRQNDNITVTGDLFVTANRDIIMAGSAMSVADGGELLYHANQNLAIGFLQATNVSLEATRGDITDSRLDLTTNVRSSNLRAVAGGEIGDSDPASSAGTNTHAIDTEVVNLAAKAASGIHVHEVLGGGSIIIRNVAEVSVNVSVKRSNFNSTATTTAVTERLAGLADLTTVADGDIKLQTANGRITIEDGTGIVTAASNGMGISAHGTGDVLLEARGAVSDLIINSALISGTGHITCISADDIDLNSGVTTAGAGTIYFIAGNGTADPVGSDVDGINVNGSIRTAEGDILLSSKRDIRQTHGIMSSAGAVGLIASRNIVQGDAGDITANAGDVFVEAGTNWTMGTDTIISAGGGDVDGKAIAGVLSLGRINAARVALSAGGDISDSNGVALNVDGTSLSLRAGGQIGSHDDTNGTPESNAKAVDTQVMLISAEAAGGIYVEEMNNLTVDTVSVLSVQLTVQQANFNSSQTAETRTQVTGSLEDLTSTANGPIKIVTKAGSLTINGGTSSASGLIANGAGDILLEARGTGSDVILNSDVTSGNGRITLNAADSIVVNHDVITGGAGSIYLSTGTGSITLNDADDNSAGMKTSSGDILFVSRTSVTLNADLRSLAGDIGINAGADVLQNANISSGRDLLIVSGRDITMSGSAVSIANGGELLFDANGDIAIGLVQATNVSMDASGDILDSRTDLTTNVRATNLRIAAGGEIGGDDAVGPLNTNRNAIDLEVTNLAARSANGIHLQEVVAGGAIVVRDVAAVSVTVVVERANFNSTATLISQSTVLAGMADLTTVKGGDIKLVAAAGSISVQDGVEGIENGANGVGVSANGNGDVLLEARGVASDIVINARLLSGTGHVTLNAGDDVTLNSSITTAGTGTVYLLAANGTTDAVGTNFDGININATITTSDGDQLFSSDEDIRQTESIDSSGVGTIGMIVDRDVVQLGGGDIKAGGDVLIEAGRNWTMSSDAVITANGGDFIGLAVRGDISLGRINSARAALTAFSDIIDANASALNIAGTSASLRATTGRIGNSDTSNNTPEINARAIDTNVATLAASSATGIYIEELNGLTIDSVAAVTVAVRNIQRANFNSSTTAVPESRFTASLEDLTTSANGSIKILAKAGTLTVNGGTDLSSGVKAHGTGDILLESREAASDVVVNASIISGTGHITLSADDDLDINADIATTGQGSVRLLAGNGVLNLLSPQLDGIDLDANVSTENGDVLITSEANFLQTAVIQSLRGDIGILTTRDVIQTSTGDIISDGGDVLVSADGHWTMSTGTMISAGGGEVYGEAVAGNLALGFIQSQHIALSAGGNISDANGDARNVDGQTLSLLAGGRIGEQQTTNGTPAVNGNAIDTRITTLAARSSRGIYIEEEDGLTIDTVDKLTVTVADVRRANFNSTTSPLLATVSSVSLEDLTTTTGGPVKIVSLNGSISVNSGAASSGGIMTNGTGDILLEARGTDSHVILDANIRSDNGNISIDAADSVVVSHDVATGGAGTVYVLARAGTITLNDLDANSIGIATQAGGVLLDAATHVILNANIESASDIGIRSGADVQQNSDLLAGGDLLVTAGRDITMAAGANSVANGGELIYKAGGNLAVGVLQATNVSIEATTGDIVDSGNDLNTNVRASNLRMIAGGQIGNRDLSGATGTNVKAIDTEVANLAAQSATGVHVLEVAAGGSITVRDVADVSVTVTIDRANFNSTTTRIEASSGLAGLADLVTTNNGDVKLLAVNGTITLLDGSNTVANSGNGVSVSAHGTGTVLLEARGLASDIAVYGDVQSAAGHITIIARDDVTLASDVITGGSGTVYVLSSNKNAGPASGINMQNGSSIITGGGNVRLVADNESDIRVSHIDAAAGNVSLAAEGSILDSNGAALNIAATALRMVADASLSNVADGIGIIGGPDTANTVDNNLMAIDTQVITLAAQSAEGIYVHETDGLIVQGTGDIRVQQTNFNGSTTTISDASLSDLTTTNNGVIKLQSASGSIVLTDGEDGDNQSVSAHGTGDILIQALAASSDIVVDSRISSGTGHVTLHSGDDIDLHASLATGGNGTVFLLASNGTIDSSAAAVDGITINAMITTVDGDVLLKSTRDIQVNQSVGSRNGDIGLISGRDLAQGNSGDLTSVNSDIFVDSTRHWTMASEAVITAGGGEVFGRARSGNLALGLINSDHVALIAGLDISDANGSLQNINGQSISLRAGGSIGTESDRLETRVTTLAALAATGIFISEANGLTVDTVAEVTVRINDPVHVNFNSTTTAVPEIRTVQSLEDLTTTSNGPIRIRTGSGSLTINSGVDSRGILAEGTGEILLNAVGSVSDLAINASMSSATGSVLLTADDDIDVNASIMTGGLGNVTLTASNLTEFDSATNTGSEVDGINIDAPISTVGGDVLADSALDIRQTSTIISETGHITVRASRDVLQQGQGDISTSNADVLVEAGRDWTMSTDTVITSLNGAVGGRTIAGELSLGQINSANVALVSNGSIRDINGTRQNVVADTLSLFAGQSVGDHNNPSRSPGLNADAIDIQVVQLAAVARNSISLNERDSLIVDRINEQVIGGFTFNSVSGIRTTNGDVFLNVEGNLALNQSVQVGTGDVRIITDGSVTQTAAGRIIADELGLRQESIVRGDVILLNANDVNIFSVDNDFDSGRIEFHDVDDLIVRSVAAQIVGVLSFSSTEGITATGGDVSVKTDGDLTVLKTIASVNGVEDRNAQTGESITLESVDGNILIDATAGAIDITSDEATGSNEKTGDKITLIADSDRSYSGDLDGDRIVDSNDADVDGDGVINSMDPVLDGIIEGNIAILGDVTFSTDGGVAKRFGPRPELGRPSTAFFVNASNPLSLAIDNSPATWKTGNAYIDAFFVHVGVAGEENLTVDLDWQDPAEEPDVVTDTTTQTAAKSLGVLHAISSERIQQFLVEEGGNRNTVAHLYTARDFTLFQTVRQSTTIVVDLSVSQHSSIDLQGVSVSQTGFTQSVPGRDLASSDNAITGPGIFESGIATFKIPTVTPAPPALFSNGFVPRGDRPAIVASPENTSATAGTLTADFGSGAAGGTAFTTEVYFQIRRQFESDAPSEVVVEKVMDSSLISSREAFEEFVRMHPELQDGAGYEIWLISETGGQKVQRPVVEFEITGGQPGTASESVPDQSAPPQLRDLPFEQPAEAESPPEPGDSQTLFRQPAPEVISTTFVSVVSEQALAIMPSHADHSGGADLAANVSSVDGQDVSVLGVDAKVDEATDLSSADVGAGTIVGLAVSRFRNRQRDAATVERRYSKAARFARRNS